MSRKGLDYSQESVRYVVILFGETRFTTRHHQRIKFSAFVITTFLCVPETTVPPVFPMPAYLVGATLAAQRRKRDRLVCPTSILCTGLRPGAADV